jgi:GxxExxY protein
MGAVSRQAAESQRAFEEPTESDNALAGALVDAALEVHRHLGPGFAENVYENALCHELSLRELAFDRQVVVAVSYKGAAVGQGRADRVVGGRLIVEIKALPALAPVHTAQVISYLKATGLTLALLVNFGERQLRTGLRRVVRSP